MRHLKLLGSRPRENRVPILKNLLRLLVGCQLGGIALLNLHGLLKARNRVLQSLQIRQNQLGINGLHVRGRINLAVHMNHVWVIKRAHHLRDCVCLTNIRQELIPQPLTLRGTLHNTRNINERDGRGQNTLRPENLGEPVQAGIRQVHHTNIRLNRSERVVSRQHRVAGERVEQGGLAHVRKTDNADSQSHRKSFIMTTIIRPQPRVIPGAGTDN